MTITRWILIFVFLGSVLYFTLYDSSVEENIAGWKLKSWDGEAELFSLPQEVDVKTRVGHPPEKYHYSFFLRCSDGSMQLYTSSDYIVKSELSPNITLRAGQAYLSIEPKGLNSAEFMLIESEDDRFNELISEMKRSRALNIGFGDFVTLNSINVDFSLKGFSKAYDALEVKCHLEDSDSA